jgi:hypothetical protein
MSFGEQDSVPALTVKDLAREESKEGEELTMARKEYLMVDDFGIARAEST